MADEEDVQVEDAPVEEEEVEMSVLDALKEVSQVSGRWLANVLTHDISYELSGFEEGTYP